MEYMGLLVVLKKKRVVVTKIGNGCRLHCYEARMGNILLIVKVKAYLPSIRSFHMDCLRNQLHRYNSAND